MPPFTHLQAPPCQLDHGIVQIFLKRACALNWSKTKDHKIKASSVGLDADKHLYC